jgi:hypothetical protein
MVAVFTALPDSTKHASCAAFDSKARIRKLRESFHRRLASLQFL